jgi:radical SAM superfamily enzyme YgiQ (UPF0313 family)
MLAKRQVLFIQLPQLDNDVSDVNENVPIAAAYLRHAAELAGEHRFFAFQTLPEPDQHMNTGALADLIARRAPDVVAATLYLWNIERTLRLFRLLRTRLPNVKLFAGGPEVARRHPFLFRRHDADVIVAGEGEAVFPALLRALRGGRAPDFDGVATRTATGYRWGRQPAPPVDLATQLPPPGYGPCRPDARGMAYLETSRGCPMRCAYCRYPHLRRTLSFLPAAQALARVKALARLGAREIRFVDPTFNAHPEFRAILRRLAGMRRTPRPRFFAELNAAALTREDAALLAAAGFAEVEVGMQSRDPRVLRAIRRPSRLQPLDAGLRHLARERIKVTLDVMYGLPEQRLADVIRSTRWALGFPRANVQCLQTLLLPGTELRDCRARWRLRSEARPPYAVTATGTMSPDDFRAVERLLQRTPRLRSDVPTTRFVGARLPDLFPEQHRLAVPLDLGGAAVPGTGIRRAFLLEGPDLFARRAALTAFLRRVIRREPDSLFQFVLAPRHEEPLDLLERLANEIRAAPPHLLDRTAAVALAGKSASRRLLILARPEAKLAADWQAAAEAALSQWFA